MKEPILVVTRKNLIKLLNEAKDMGIDESNLIVDFAMSATKAFPDPLNLTINISAPQIYKDIVVNKFKFYVDAKRRELGHRGIRQLKPSHSHYNNMVKAAYDAKEFADIFGFSLELGMMQYIDYGLKLFAKKFSFSRFGYYKERMFNMYQDELIIKQDMDSDITSNLYKYYCKKAGRDVDFTVDYVYAKTAMKRYGIESYVDWVDAQFHGLEFLNQNPTPTQLHNDNAKKRYDIYIVKGKTKSYMTDDYRKLMMKHD